MFSLKDYGWMFLTEPILWSGGYKKSQLVDDLLPFAFVYSALSIDVIDDALFDTCPSVDEALLELLVSWIGVLYVRSCSFPKI